MGAGGYKFEIFPETDEKQFLKLTNTTIKYIEGNPLEEFKKDNEQTVSPKEDDKDGSSGLIKRVEIEGFLDDNQKIIIGSRGENKLIAYIRDTKGDKLIIFTKAN